MKFLLLMMLATGLISAQEKSFKSTAEIDQFMVRFFDMVENGKYELAYNSIKPYTSIGDATMDGLARQTRTQFARVKSNYGSSSGIERVRIEKTEGVMMRYTYIHKFDVLPLRWLVIFYNPGNGWRIINFKYDEEYKELFWE